MVEAEGLDFQGAVTQVSAGGAVLIAGALGDPASLRCGWALPVALSAVCAVRGKVGPEVLQSDVISFFDSHKEIPNSGATH